MEFTNRFTELISLFHIVSLMYNSATLILTRD